MAYLKPKRIHGHTYWYIAESRRVSGRVKTVNLAYLGRADDLMDRLADAQRPHERLKSFSHGGVAVLLSLADRLGLVELMERHVRPPGPARPGRGLLSVGQTLLLAAIGRALHPTSKRGWSLWARGTTLGTLWGFEAEKITSAFFWDQMDRLPVEALMDIQAELGRRVMAVFGVAAEGLFYDVTNFYTFIDSRNGHCDLPQRGKNKQKRNDLRQFQVGMLVSRDGWVPLLAKVYRGNQNDVTTFPDALAAIDQQCGALGLDPRQVTLVADKGNISKKNWRLLDASPIGHVVSLVPSHYKEWAYQPLEAFGTCEVPHGGEVRVLRGQAEIAGRQRTIIVLDSPALRDGQLRGLQQQMLPVGGELSELQNKLRQAKRRRQRKAIEEQIQRALAQRPAVAKLMRWELTQRRRRPGFWTLDWWVDPETFALLRDRQYGRRVLATNRDGWATESVIQAYGGQGEAEQVFRQLKDPLFLALRPQYHWTDQKIQVHSFCCVVGYLLGALVRRHARSLGYTEGLSRLLEMLNGVRMVLRTEQTGRAGRPRVHWQREETDAAALALYKSLAAPKYELGPTSPSV
ncbi:MAG: IS1634 family transposase [Planctomycetota bacterium]|jgi:transposase